jgi:hypothetical protein
MKRFGFALRALLVGLVCIGSAVHAAPNPPVAEPPSVLDDARILGHDRYGFRVESVMTRVTAFEQTGTGYQSQAGPLLGAGSEHATILEPQAEIVAKQGDRLTHRFTVPLDIVTAASPDAVDRHRDKVDAISSASRQNYAGAFDWTATYKVDRDSDVSIRSGLHLEEPFRSWQSGLAYSRALADGSTTLSTSVLAVFDWFDNFDTLGFRSGRTNRSSTTGSIGITQLLTPTTLFIANYGFTVQKGQLGNTWNSVPLASGKRGAELLPSERVRHAFVARASQFLPWNGALKLYYRLYDDDWGIIAHSAQAELMQRVLPFLYVGALYRFHRQTGVDFFTTSAPRAALLRTADSDLAELDAQTFGGKVVLDVPLDGDIRVLHVDIGYERYVRTNDLQMNVLTWSTGYRF